MSECDDLQSIRKADKDDVIRKCMNGHTPDVILIDARDATSDLWECLDELERPPRFGHKPLRNPSVAVEVPSGRFPILGLRRLDDA